VLPTGKLRPLRDAGNPSGWLIPDPEVSSGGQKAFDWRIHQRKSVDVKGVDCEKRKGASSCNLFGLLGRSFCTEG
jgi:hypothetical protein